MASTIAPFSPSTVTLSVSTSSGVKARSDASSSSTCPCARSRSTRRSSVSRESSTTRSSGRPLPAEALDETQGRGRRRQLLGVVEDQDEVVVEGGLERVAQQGGQRFGLHELVVGRDQVPTSSAEPVTKGRSASAIPAANEDRRRSPAVAVCQVETTSSVHPETSVDFPYPAPAVTSVRRLPNASSRRPSRRGRRRTSGVAAVVPPARGES